MYRQKRVQSAHRVDEECVAHPKGIGSDDADVSNFGVRLPSRFRQILDVFQKMFLKVQVQMTMVFFQLQFASDFRTSFAARILRNPVAGAFIS